MRRLNMIAICLLSSRQLNNQTADRTLPKAAPGRIRGIGTEDSEVVMFAMVDGRGLQGPKKKDGSGLVGVASGFGGFMQEREEAGRRGE